MKKIFWLLTIVLIPVLLIHSCTKDGDVPLAKKSPTDTTVVPVKKPDADSTVPPVVPVFPFDTCSYPGIIPDTFIQNRYNGDAVQLYLRDIHNNPQHPNYNQAELDQSGIRRILVYLHLIHSLNTPQTDSVFYVNRIHALYCVGTSGVSLKVNTTDHAIINLADGIIPTGNPQLDEILATWHFDSVRTSYSYPKFPWLTVITKNVYNLIPVVNAFKQVPLFTNAEASGGCFDGDDISLEYKENKVIVTFSIGYGDCPAGCIGHNYWRFSISDGIAEFIGY